MKDMSDIINLLKSIPQIEYLGYVNIDEHGFSRTIAFILRSVTYKIEWYSNISYLYVGEMIVPFINVEHTDTYPHNYKSELRFTINKDNAYFPVIIPVE